jgi:topoisomerase IA-like protein/ribosomal protein L12E/L44/L45/RPP1/RPP2
MESSLDKISQGSEEKQRFLSEFYLGKAGVEDSGLLSRVARKLNNEEIDHKESRTLVIPFLEDIGVVQLGRSGAFIERHMDRLMTGSGHDNDKELKHILDGLDATADTATTDSHSNIRWKLPEAMQIDMREITKAAVELVMATETTMQGSIVGDDPVSGRSVMMRSGRFGRYMQIGLDAEKNRTTYSIPQWLQNTAPLQDILEFAKLPRAIYIHPVLNLSIIAEVSAAQKQLCVGIEGYPLRIPVPENILVSEITEELAFSLLQDTTAILDSQRILGDWNEEQVLVKQGRFGYYVRCGKLIAGLRKLDHTQVTLEECIEILTTRGKTVGAKKKGKSKKATKIKEKKIAVKKLSGYQVYLMEIMKTGKKMGEAAASWKLLDIKDQEVYKEKASAITPTLNSEPTEVKIKSTVKRLSGYQIFASEAMKNGQKMAQAAAEWKLLDLASQEVFKEKAAAKLLLDSQIDNQARTDDNHEISKSEKDLKSSKKNKIKAKTNPEDKGSKRLFSGYQIFVSEVMKTGLKMAEAVSRWRELPDPDKESFKSRASEINGSQNKIEKSSKKVDKMLGNKSTPIDNIISVKKSSGYQIYVSEIMKNGGKMGDAATSWKALDSKDQEVYKEKAKLSSQ